MPESFLELISAEDWAEAAGSSGSEAGSSMHAVRSVMAKSKMLAPQEAPRRRREGVCAVRMDMHPV